MTDKQRDRNVHKNCEILNLMKCIETRETAKGGYPRDDSKGNRGKNMIFDKGLFHRLCDFPQFQLLETDNYQTTNHNEEQRNG